MVPSMSSTTACGAPLEALLCLFVGRSLSASSFSLGQCMSKQDKHRLQMIS